MKSKYTFLNKFAYSIICLFVFTLSSQAQTDIEAPSNSVRNLRLTSNDLSESNDFHTDNTGDLFIEMNSIDEVFRINDDTENIGIGDFSSSAPADKLHILGSLRLDNSTTRTINFYNGASRSYYISNFSSGLMQFVNSTSENVQFWTNSGNTKALELFSDGIAASPYGRIAGNTDGLAWAFGVTGQSIFRGADSNGTSTGAINTRSGSQSMWLDGNEIDSNEDLHLNFNTQNDVNLRTNVDRADVNMKHTSGSGLDDGFAIENEGANNNYWTLYTVNANGEFELYYNGTKRGDFDDVSGAYTQVSDRKLKTNITDLPSALNRVMATQPKEYTFIADDENRKQIGFIAQELESVFPEAVHKGTVGDTNEELYTVDYASLSAAAFQAIKEQQAIIEQLKADVEALKKK